MENNTTANESKEEVKKNVSTPTKTQDRHTAEEVVKDSTQIDPFKLDDKEYIVLPTATYDTIRKMLVAIQEMDDKGVISSTLKIDQPDGHVVALNIDNRPYTYIRREYIDRLNTALDSFVNVVRYADKTIGIKSINFANSSGIISGSAALARLRSALNKADVIHVPLWHSGFWVTLKPPTQKELIILDSQIAESYMTIGRITNTLLYSNHGVVYNRIVTDFIVSHINSTTLQIPDTADIRDYILVQDLNILYLGLISTMYPKGVDIIRSCQNSYVMSEDNKPVCNYEAKGLVDPKKLLWVDRTTLTDKMLTHMTNRLDNSMTLESVLEYQKSIEAIVDKTYTLTSSEGVNIKLTLSLPTVSKYVTDGEKWVNNIVTESERLFTRTDNDEQKNEKIAKMLSSNILGVYNTFIKVLEYEFNTNTDDPDAQPTRAKSTTPEDINIALAELSLNELILPDTFDKIRDFINTTAIAIVATPNFKCPTCGSTQEIEKDKWFSELIPLDVLQYFLVLCGSRMRMTTEKIYGEEL